MLVDEYVPAYERQGLSGRERSCCAAALAIRRRALCNRWVDRAHPLGRYLRLALRLKNIAEKHDLTVAEMRSRRRLQEFVDARQEFYYAGLMEDGESTTAVGRVARRDHTTVIAGARAYADRHGLPKPRKRMKDISP